MRVTIATTAARTGAPAITPIVPAPASGRPSAALANGSNAQQSAITSAARRRAEGKTGKEALRALKRHLIRALYRLLKSCAEREVIEAAGAPAAPLHHIEVTQAQHGTS